MNKRLFPMVIFSLSFSLFADAFLDDIQLIAFITACAGQYSNVQAGYDNNKEIGNYYTPEMYAEGFKSMSGSRTSSQLFYGICTDYAFAAWNYIDRYKHQFTKDGMKEDSFYIVSTNDDEPNTIYLFKPILNEEKAESDYKINGINMIKISEVRALAHKNATEHSWIWIQKNDGVWYWIDPTYSDNTGYIHVGYVSNGKEEYIDPNSRYTIKQRSERKTRVDKYGNQQIKIIWNTSYTSGPNNENWAKDSWGNNWTSAIRYEYLIDPQQNTNKISRATVTLYANNNADYYDYTYKVTLQIEKDSITELVRKKDYYSNQYNQAKADFDSYANMYEDFVAE